MAKENNEQKHTIEDVLEKYAAEQEGTGPVAMSPESPTARKAAELKQQADDFVSQRMTLKEEQEKRQAEAREGARELGLGFVEVPLEDLPSRGMFYPADTKIHVRAASGGDLRKWSMLDETEIQQIDNAINDVLERCVTISSASTNNMSFRDVKELDRIYLALCVRDFTFTEGTNDLKIDVNEGEQVTVKKDNISFIEFPEWMLKYYNNEKRCFVFPSATPSGKGINVYMPSVGVTRWLKEYIQRKSRAQEQFDQEFITIAPMLIRDYRELTDRAYTDLVIDSLNWPAKTWAVISKVKSAMQKAVRPKIVYIDESSGAAVEKELPLNFRGGIKSIFEWNVDDELGV